ncbi:mitochondrial ribosomal protein subunit L20-domain-containing protein [Geopyxis carbonaria]|nr:mitochondrial ribosomal protein subunit L20-domain-containing protein [Geopyxis carbonaria]
MNSLAPFLRQALRAGPASKSFVRHESSARRHTKALRLHPHSSMKITEDSPATDHIIFNPPSSAPTPLITPRLFLPKDDPRHAVLPEPVLPENHRMPPPVRKPYQKTYHLNPADFRQMRNLRKQNPKLWTRNALAHKFNCSTLFVGMVTQASEERLKEVAEMGEKLKDRWGNKRRLAREERVIRRSGWGGADAL